MIDRIKKERPILFNTEMVRAILDGRKTQTRRPVKPPPPDNTYSFHAIQGFNELAACFISSDMTKQAHWTKLHSKVGDRLYVRETWAVEKRKEKRIVYKANNSNTPIDFDRWRPSIHMPKYLARIWLEITDIRVERVKDITMEDSINEGVKTLLNFEKNYGMNARGAFIDLWNSIYKNWKDNPWVFVREFKRVSK